VRFHLAIAAVALAVSGLQIPVSMAADAPVSPRSDYGAVHHRYARVQHRHLGCPDGYSCYPLYGAYGPYGGPAYWAAYSVSLPEYYR
jgi:hypothetical protein